MLQGIDAHGIGLGIERGDPFARGSDGGLGLDLLVTAHEAARHQLGDPRSVAFATALAEVETRKPLDLGARLLDLGARVANLAVELGARKPGDGIALTHFVARRDFDRGDLPLATRHDGGEPGLVDQDALPGNAHRRRRQRRPDRQSHGQSQKAGEQEPAGARHKLHRMIQRFRIRHAIQRFLAEYRTTQRICPQITFELPPFRKGGVAHDVKLGQPCSPDTRRMAIDSVPCGNSHRR